MSSYDFSILPARLRDRVQFAANGCWIWTLSKQRGGYGLVRWGGGNMKKAHRVFYELLVGPIPDGYQLDHTCHNRDDNCAGGLTCGHRACVNPEHLEPVTGKVNSLRGKSQMAEYARRETCECGAEFSQNKRGRFCYPCSEARRKQYIGENRERYDEYHQQYRDAHRDEKREYNRAYLEANRAALLEKQRERSRAYHAANRDEENAKTRDRYHATDPEVRREKARRKRANMTPEQREADNARQRAAYRARKNSDYLKGGR
jgi:hypothetical protein